MFTIHHMPHAPCTVEFEGVIIGTLTVKHGIMSMRMLARPIVVQAVDMDELEVRTFKAYAQHPADILREAELWWFGENLID